MGSYLTRWTGTVTYNAKGLQKFLADCVAKLCALNIASVVYEYTLFPLFSFGLGEGVESTKGEGGREGGSEVGR